MDEVARLERALAETERMWRRERDNAAIYCRALDRIQIGCRRMAANEVWEICHEALTRPTTDAEQQVADHAGEGQCCCEDCQYARESLNAKVAAE